MRTLTLRRWLVLSLIAIFIVPVMLFNVTVLLVGGSGWWTAVNRPVSQQSLDRAAAVIGTNVRQWSDPSWRQSTGTQLNALDVGAELFGPDGNRVGDAGTVPTGRHGGPWGASSDPARVVQLRGGNDEVIGTINLFDTSSGSHQPFLAGVVAGFSGLLLALIGTGWLLGHYVVRPLESASLAAHRIAGGDLEFSVPKSRVSEVDEVSDAFEAMKHGLQASITRQAELEEERRFFVGAIAHDLRTPLFSLRGYLQGLESGIARTPEKIASYVAICQQKATQIERLVADLSSYARVENLEQTLHIAPVEIDPLFVRAVEGMRPRSAPRNIQLALEGSAGEVRIQGDADLLERAILNLLDNAVRHSPDGGTILIERHVANHRIEFSVADGGSGIDPRDLPHLFDPFFRGDESRNPETGGAGLGLTIARRIMRAHGGDLTAENRAEGGACFRAWLPIS